MWICRVQAKGGHGFPLYHPLAPSSLLRVPPRPKARAVQRCCKGPRWPRQVQAVHGFVVLERFIMHDQRGAGPIVPAQLLAGSHIIIADSIKNKNRPSLITSITPTINTLIVTIVSSHCCPISGGVLTNSIILACLNFNQYKSCVCLKELMKCYFAHFV